MPVRGVVRHQEATSARRPHRVQDVNVDTRAIQRVVIGAVQRQAGLINAIKVPRGVQLLLYCRCLLRGYGGVWMQCLDTLVLLQSLLLSGCELQETWQVLYGNVFQSLDLLPALLAL